MGVVDGLGAEYGEDKQKRQDNIAIRIAINLNAAVEAGARFLSFRRPELVEGSVGRTGIGDRPFDPSTSDVLSSSKGSGHRRLGNRSPVGLQGRMIASSLET